MARQSRPRKSIQYDSGAVSQRKLHLVVNDLAGGLLEFDMVRNRPLSAVKERICEHRGLPVASQQIIINESIAENSRPILAYCEDDASEVIMHIMLCDDELYSQMGSHNSNHVRLGAISSLVALAELKRTDAERFVHSMCLCLEDSSQGIRNEAAGALVQVVRKGDQLAVREVALRLTHPVGAVRCSAAVCLGVIADRGDAYATDVLTRRLSDDCVVVQLAASEALLQVASLGNMLVIQALIPVLKSPHTEVRKQAAVSLGELARKGDSLVAKALAECIVRENPWSDVVAVGLAALRKVAVVGDKDAVHCVQMLLRDPQMLIVATLSQHIDVALHALAAIADPSDSQAGDDIASTVGLIEALVDLMQTKGDGLSAGTAVFLKSARLARSRWERRLLFECR